MATRSPSALAAVPVFYSPAMVAPDMGGSPSAHKPAEVVASWRRLGVALDVRAPQPVTVDELVRVHDAAFVEGVLAGRVKNGFGNTDRRVATTLRLTSGAMLSAARFVLEAGAPVAAAPCSGFHHAGVRAAGGFCTFNGLVVAAAALRAEGRVQRVGILDCDMHYGDGTDELLDALDAHGWIEHWTAGSRFHAPKHRDGFFRALPRALDAMGGCDVVLYQAGADPHVDDPLGGFLTTTELARRDELVFRALRARGVPVVWNLAGGYQRDPDGSIRKVLEIHDNTMRACAAVFLSSS